MSIVAALNFAFQNAVPPQCSKEWGMDVARHAEET